MSGAGAADAVAALVGRERLVVWSGVTGLVLLAWLYLWHHARAMAPDSPADGAGGLGGMAPMLAPWTATDLVLTVSMWTIMMVGMMLPAAAPVILLFAAVNRRRRTGGGFAVPTAVFVLGYLAVWSAFSVGATLCQWALHGAALLSPALRVTSPILGGALLVGAGVYQLTPLKDVCLAHCRSPLGFFMTEWRDGVAGALRMGVRHGAYCLGCCWILMGLLFAAGVMNLAWVAAISAFVLLEKAMPGGVLVGRVAGGGLVLGGLVLLGQAVIGR